MNTQKFRIDYKNPEQTAEELKRVNGLVKGEILDGKPLTVESVIGMLLGSPQAYRKPVPDECVVTFILSDTKVLKEEIPAGNWPLYVTKTTYGPITIHCRPERTSAFGALIKLRPENFMFKPADDFKAFREVVASINANLTSLAKQYEQDQEKKNKKVERSVVSVPAEPAFAS